MMMGRYFQFIEGLLCLAFLSNKPVPMRQPAKAKLVSHFLSVAIASGYLPFATYEKARGGAHAALCRASNRAIARSYCLDVKAIRAAWFRIPSSNGSNSNAYLIWVTASSFRPNPCSRTPYSWWHSAQFGSKLMASRYWPVICRKQSPREMCSPQRSIELKSLCNCRVCRWPRLIH